MKTKIYVLLILFLTAGICTAQNVTEFKTIQVEEGTINTVALCGTGNIAVVGYEDGKIEGYDIKTGTKIYTVNRLDGKMSKITPNKKGNYFITASFDNKAMICKVSDGKILKIFTKNGSQVWSADISSNSKYVVTGMENGAVKVWEVTTGQEFRTFWGHSGVVFDVKFTPDNKYVISASKDKTIKIWDYPKALELHTLTGHTHYVLDMDISPDSKTLVSAARDNILFVCGILKTEQKKLYCEDICGMYFRLISARTENISSVLRGIRQ